ncbi:MAG TPA: HPP family protein [Geobacteraceae bacterium]
MKRRLMQVPAKVCGRRRAAYTPSPLKHAAWSLISSTLAILAVYALARLTGHPLLIGSFGASAVLLFGVTDSPLAQPRNLIGGHLVSAGVAVAMVALFGSGPLPAACAVGLAIMLMNLTRTNHPPGGATALIGVQGGAGPAFILVPVLAGALILLLIALFTNNIVYHRHYPHRW